MYCFSRFSIKFALTSTTSWDLNWKKMIDGISKNTAREKNLKSYWIYSAKKVNCFFKTAYFSFCPIIYIFSSLYVHSSYVIKIQKVFRAIDGFYLFFSKKMNGSVVFFIKFPWTSIGMRFKLKFGIYQKAKLERQKFRSEYKLKSHWTYSTEMDLFPKYTCFTFKCNKKVLVDPKSIYFSAHVHLS